MRKYIDAQGIEVAEKYVRPYDRKRDRIACQIAKEWVEMEARLAALKVKTFTLIEHLQTEAAVASGVPEMGVKTLGGKQGYIQFRSFDGKVTIRVDNAKRTEFDERLKFAEQLIMEAVKESAVGAQNEDLVEIATRAFTPRASGGLDMARVRELRTYKVRHPKWTKACEIIADCERVIGHRRYVRVAVPDGEQQRYVCLDIAGL